MSNPIPEHRRASSARSADTIVIGKGGKITNVDAERREKEAAAKAKADTSAADAKVKADAASAKANKPADTSKEEG